MLVILPASAKAHGEETSVFPFLGGNNEKTEDIVTKAENSTQDVEIIEVKDSINTTEVEEAQSIIDEIESSTTVANENSSAKKQLFIYTNDADLLLQEIEGIQLKKEFDGGIIAIVPESQFAKLTELGIKFLTVTDYNKKISSEGTIIAYANRNIERERHEVTYNEIKEAEEEAAKKLEELGISEDNPYAYYFIYTDALPDVSTPSAAYSKTSSIYYMSDSDLWGQTEKWISPNQVYELTPSMSVNPTGQPVSDCEEHAMTFVALCRKAGVKATDVRVVTGYVEINGEKYGHAWAQLKVNDEWVDIETTSGSYVKDNKIYKVTPIDMYFYQDLTYPSLEIWSYFNDEYYVSASGRNAPDDWQIKNTAYSAISTDTSFAGFLQYLYTYIKMEMYKLI